MKLFNSLFLFFGFCTALSAQSDPTIICVTNQSNNDILVEWTVGTCENPPNELRLFGGSGVNPTYTELEVFTAPFPTSYTHVGALGINNDWSYYLQACGNEFSDTVDNSAPDVPLIRRVTIEDSCAVIEWEPSQASETFKYRVSYYFTPIFQEFIDTVFGRLNTSYADTIKRFDPNSEAIEYTVTAYDFCDNNGGPNLKPHKTIFLDSVEENACTRSSEYIWSGYQGWEVGAYHVYVQVNGGAFERVVELDSSARSFVHSGYNDGDSLCVYVEAVQLADTSIKSRSNMRCYNSFIVQPPSFFYMTNATVINNESVQLSWIIDTTSALRRYSLLRDEGERKREFESRTVPIPLNGFETGIDSFIDVQERLYHYEIDAITPCGDKFTSTRGAFIYATGELIDFFVNEVRWTPFEVEFATVKQYNIYRTFEQGTELIATVGPEERSYADDISIFRTADGLFCYTIEAEYDIDFPNGISLSGISTSNQACVAQRVLFYIPEAFTPGRGESVYRPEILFGDVTDYSMVIFDRWGAQMFTSNDFNKGWDGTKNGSDVPTGGYPYVIQFKTPDGNPILKKGIVILAR